MQCIFASRTFIYFRTMVVFLLGSSHFAVCADVQPMVKIYDQSSYDASIATPFDDQLTMSAIDDEGVLTVVTSLQILRSTESGALHAISSLPDNFPKPTDYRSLSPDGHYLAYIDQQRHVQLADVQTGALQPIQLPIPGNGRPVHITVAAGGKLIAVRFNPDYNIDDPNGERKALAHAPKPMPFDWTKPLIRGPVIRESYALFRLPNTEPLVTDVEYNSVGPMWSWTPMISAEPSLVCWVGPAFVMRWNYQEPDSKPQATLSERGEIVAGYFNKYGDVVYRRNIPGLSDLNAEFMWQLAEDDRQVLVTGEYESKDHRISVALADDRQRLFIADGKSNGTKIRALTMPERKRLWQVDIPGEVDCVRLSPANRYLVANLTQGSFATIKLD